MSPAATAERAPAKVNLYLRVVGQRPDGYHLLDSLVAFPAAADRVTAAPAEQGLSLALDGPQAGALAAEPDNLVLRAARALAAAAGLPALAALRLTKNLPVASGIGGGSADAAAALRALSILWGLHWPAERLRGIAAELGADVPVCVESRPARMGGIGEVLLPAPALPACGMVLVNPGLPLATPAVFRARTGAFSPPAEMPAAFADAAALAAWLNPLGNDLQEAAISLCPPVAEVLAALGSHPDCLLARMSGSGATCFGLFPDAPRAERAASSLPAGWWRWGGAMG